jgi:pimeloyl-ACP methyl ester carboxylesterase
MVRPSNPDREQRITRVATGTADGVALRGRWLREPGERELAVVVGHGFTHNVATQLTSRLLARVARRADVLAFDFRGHGRSGGSSQVGGAEEYDIDAAVRYARDRGYARVATLGFSMGACAAIKHAGQGCWAGDARSEPTTEAVARRARSRAPTQLGEVDAVASVSSPARWFERSTRPMRRVNRLLEQPCGRTLARALGVRLGEPWDDPLPASPVEVAHRIAPTPLLIVHGTADRYFPLTHAHALHAAAGASAELWTPGGIGHGEKGMTPDVLDAIVDWLLARAGASESAAADTVG